MSFYSFFDGIKIHFEDILKEKHTTKCKVEGNTLINIIMSFSRKLVE